MERYVDDATPPPGSRVAAKVNQRLQVILDRIAPFAVARWLAWLGVLAIFAVRVYWLKGFYIVTYALGIFNLNLLLGFLTPQVDPALEGPTLPSKGNDEFKPFVRRLPEFKFWFSSSKALCLGFLATFFPMFDVPVFWPILLLYWLVLFFLTMKRQIRHMIKHRYVPFSIGKRKYAGKDGSAANLKQ